MSVKVADRTESTVQFITTAGELLKFTTDQAIKHPSRITFLHSQHLSLTVQEIYRDLEYANSLYLFTEDHARKRKELFEKALGYLDYLQSSLNITKVLVPKTTASTFKQWNDLINRERTLLRNLIKSDSERKKI